MKTDTVEEIEHIIAHMIDAIARITRETYDAEIDTIYAQLDTIAVCCPNLAELLADRLTDHLARQAPNIDLGDRLSARIKLESEVM